MYSVTNAKTARSCRFALHNIRKIRPFLTEHAAQLLVQALVISILDYCNALLAGLPSNTIKPLQMIQNAAAWLVFNEPKLHLSFGAFPLHGTARYGTIHFWGVFHWVLYLVPDTFLVPLRSRFHASRTITKTWRVNSADHWLAGENRHYCVTELATRDPPLQPDPLDLNQHSQRRIGRNFCLNKRTFLHQPQNSSVVVCWGSSEVPLVDSRGADPARAWWHDAEGKILMYITLLLNLLYFQSMFIFLPLYLCFASIKKNLIE